MQPELWWLYRPCGRCVEYVSAQFGCPHWQPKKKATFDAKKMRSVP